MADLEVGHLRLVTGVDESLETSLDEVGQTTTQHGLLTEEVGLGLLAEAGLDAAGTQTAEGLGVGLGQSPGHARSILLDADKHWDTAAVGVFTTHDVTRALRGDHADVDALGGLDVAEVDVEAMGEEEGIAVLEVRGDLFGVQLTLVLIGGQDHDHVGLLTRLLDGQHAQPLGFSLSNRRGTLAQTDPHVNAGVTQVEGMGMPLGAVTNDGNLTVLDDGQVGVIVVVDLCHGVFISLLCFGLVVFRLEEFLVIQSVLPRERRHHG